MKQLFIFLVLFIGAESLQAQSLKEKLKAKADALEQKMNSLTNGSRSARVPVFSTDLGQDEIAKTWKDGSYKFFIYGSGAWRTEENIDLKFEENEEGVIDKIMYGDEPYMLLGKSSGFGTEYYGEWNHNYLAMDTVTIVVYSKLSDDYFNVKNCINNHIGADNTVGEDLIAYVKEADKLNNELSTARGNARKAERKAKYGLEDKDVVSIKVELTPVEVKGKILLGQYGKISFNVLATLKDGSVISTSDGGYFSDYSFSYPHAQEDGYDLILPVLSDKDLYQVDVKLKKDPSITTSGQITLTYKQDLSFNWSAYGGFSRQDGESARHVDVYIEQTKNTESGEDLLMVRIVDSYSDEMLSEFKIDPSKTIYIKLYGGDGGVDEGTPTNAGNGGSVTVHVDPNVNSYNLKTGLTGGSGGKGSYYSGADGDDGSVTEIIENVNL